MQPGELLQHYELKERIGKGGFGEVFRAFDTRLEIDVAIKVLLPLYAANEEMVQRFLIGARAAARLQHPNIIRMLYLGDIPERQIFFSVMEYLPYGTLSDRIREGSMTPEDVIKTFIKITKAVQFAHDHGFIHRDIKPDNILYRENGEPVITDFDLSRVVGQARLTKDGTALGTVYYISPEQALGEDVTPHSDVYSLGVMLFYMLTSDLPFNDPQVSTLLSKHLYEPVPKASLVNPALSPALDRVIEKAMAKKKEKRYDSAQEFAEALLILFPEYEESPSKPKKPAATIPTHQTQIRDTMEGSTEKVALGAQLTVLTGNLQGMKIPLRESVLRVGFSREGGNEIGLQDDFASTRHGRFESHEGGWYYVDQNSRNGTFVLFENGSKKRLSPEEPYRLTYGDVLEIGDTQLRFDPDYD